MMQPLQSKLAEAIRHHAAKGYVPSHLEPIFAAGMHARVAPAQQPSAPEVWRDKRDKNGKERLFIALSREWTSTKDLAKQARLSVNATRNYLSGAVRDGLAKRELRQEGSTRAAYWRSA